MATTTTTVTGQQSIPTELMPYFTGAPAADGKAAVPGLLPKAQEIYSRDYDTVYAPLTSSGLSGAGGIAGLSDMQKQVGAELSTMKAPTQFTSGITAAGQAQNLFNTAPQVQAQALTDYQMTGAGDVGIGNLTNYQMANVDPAVAAQMQAAGNISADQFNAQALQQFMSPYMQSVVDVQKQQALRDAQIANMNQNLASAGRGTYGGSASVLAGVERERNLQDLLAKTQAQGLQSAYEQAVKAFEGQRGANLTAAEKNQAIQQEANRINAANQQQTALANQQAAMTAAERNLAANLGVQQLGTESKLKADLANQGIAQETARKNLEASLATQQLGSAQSLEAQKANQLAQLQAASGLSTLGDVYTRAGTAQQAADIDRLKTQGAYGDLQRGIEQQKLDAQRAEILRRIGFPEEQIGGMADILRGVPVSTSSETTTQTAPAPSFASQLGGMGLTGLSLYNMLK